MDSPLNKCFPIKHSTNAKIVVVCSPPSMVNIKQLLLNSFAATPFTTCYGVELSSRVLCEDFIINNNLSEIMASITQQPLGNAPLVYSIWGITYIIKLVGFFITVQIYFSVWPLNFIFSRSSPNKGVIDFKFLLNRMIRRDGTKMKNATNIGDELRVLKIFTLVLQLEQLHKLYNYGSSKLFQFYFSIKIYFCYFLVPVERGEGGLLDSCGRERNLLLPLI